MALYISLIYMVIIIVIIIVIVIIIDGRVVFPMFPVTVVMNQYFSFL